VSASAATTIPGLSKAHLTIPIGVVAVLALIVIPLPSPLLDMLLTVNLSLSIVVLLTSMYVPKPVEFSVFPSLLLLLTLFRLALNIASTRLILLYGDKGTAAAGTVIKSFGEFVVGGSFVVGLVVFLVMLVVQFVVISHGSTRISEVIARFTLDAMPGKQMAIDADLNAGLITEKEAVDRRESIQKEAEFFGSMDGAVRFTQRDAIASLIITLINIGAGLIIGVMQKGMPLIEAVKNFSVLTIGDGLISAVPALFIAVSGALITTRASQEHSIGDEISNQLLMSPRPLRVAAGAIAAFALVPGLPKIAFLVLAGGIFAASKLSERLIGAAEIVQEEVPPPTEEAKTEEEVEPLLGVDPLCVEVGYDLIAAVGAERPGGILDKIKGLRRQVATEMGFVVPPVRVRDNLQLPQNEYVVLLRGVKVAGAKMPRNKMLALEAGAVRQIEGEKTTDPAFNLPAVWIDPEKGDDARAAGYTVVDAPSVMSTHLMEIIRRHAADLLGREDVARLIDNLQKTHPKAVAELCPERMTIGEIQRVLQSLLREGVPIRDLPVIVEALADAAVSTRDTQALTEIVRHSLARPLAGLHADNGVLRAIAFSPELEAELTRALVPAADQGSTVSLAPQRATEVIQRVNTAALGAGGHCVIVINPKVRPFLAELLRPHLPHTPVLSTLEIPPEMTLKAVATVA